MTEHICALARYVITNSLNPAYTASTQWFERTLDDSANKRIAVAEAFLAVDSILNIYINVANGLVVYPKIIEQRVMRELPFMASENIMMEAVKKGGDRQDLHERIRVHSMAAAAQVKEHGLENDLVERIVSDPVFGLSLDEIRQLLNPALFIGRCPEQVERFLHDYVMPMLAPYKDTFETDIDLKV